MIFRIRKKIILLPEGFHPGGVKIFLDNSSNDEYIEDKKRQAQNLQ